MGKLCILDFDGTLCATHEAIRSCIDMTFDRHGVERPSPHKVEAAIEAGVVMAEAMRMLTDDRLSLQKAADWATTYREFYLDTGLAHTVLFPDVERTLAALRGFDVAMVIASNKSEASVRKALEHFGIDGYLDLLVCDPQGMPKKPDPACYERLIAPAFPSVAPADIVVVGDTHADLGLARNIGALACWASYGYGDRARCLALEPDVIIDAPGALVAQLEALAWFD